MPAPKTTDLDYACEAESAERAEAWPQAAALWRRAAACFPEHPCARAAADRDQYLANAAACDRRTEVDAVLTQIAERVLRIPTLQTRGLDELDFHELGVSSIRKALWQAYEVGGAAAKNNE